MKALILRKNNNWVVIRLSGRRSKIWGKALIQEVGPNFCKWDTEDLGWAVHLDYGPAAVQLLKAGKVEIEYSENLQPTWIEFMEQKISQPISVSPRDILYVTEDAPDFVVKAAYNALMMRYHPDTGDGDFEKFTEVLEAFKEITSQD